MLYLEAVWVLLGAYRDFAGFKGLGLLLSICTVRT